MAQCRALFYWRFPDRSGVWHSNGHHYLHVHPVDRTVDFCVGRSDGCFLDDGRGSIHFWVGDKINDMM